MNPMMMAMFMKQLQQMMQQQGGGQQSGGSHGGLMNLLGGGLSGAKNAYSMAQPAGGMMGPAAGAGTTALDMGKGFLGGMGQAAQGGGGLMALLSKLFA